MKKTIFLSAGHDLNNPGAVVGEDKEAVLNMAIRDACLPLLKLAGFEVHAVPDDLDLVKSIKWVNDIAGGLDAGYALEIHCNMGRGEGAEIYYYASDNVSKGYTDKIINRFCEVTGMKNRGSKSDNLSQYPRLAWIRDTKTWAGLIEVGYMDNAYDLNKIKDAQLMAQGIVQGLCNMFGIQNPSADKDEIKKQIINLLNKL